VSRQSNFWRVEKGGRNGPPLTLAERVKEEESGAAVSLSARRVCQVKRKKGEGGRKIRTYILLNRFTEERNDSYCLQKDVRRKKERKPNCVSRNPSSYWKFSKRGEGEGRKRKSETTIWP